MVDQDADGFISEADLTKMLQQLGELAPIRDLSLFTRKQTQPLSTVRAYRPESISSRRCDIL